MKPILFFVLAVFSFLPSIVAAQTGSPIVAKTEAPELLADEGGFSFGMEEPKYMELSRKYSAMTADFIGIKQKPAGLTAAALFGYSIVIQGKNISWILDRDAQNEYILYLDLNADGNLANDKPLSFKKTGGKYVMEIHKTLTETVDNRRREYSFSLRLEAREEIRPGRTEKETFLRVQSDTLRRGSLNINDRKIAFALIGSSGIYDYDFDHAYFDLDGDGKFDSETPYSPEVFLVKEKTVNIGDASYEFTVDRYGNKLTLKPLAKKLTARMDLRIGSTAPDFSFKDLDGNARRLSDLRGKIVLIDIWGTWCMPCVREAPKLSAFYKNLKRNNFEIVSVNKGDEIPNIRKFIADNQMNWVHTKADETFLNLYRVYQFPTYFLLDKDGKIISNTLRAGEEMYKKVEELTAL